MRFVEEGIYTCGKEGCNNKAHFAQKVEDNYTVLLCLHCFCEGWGMPEGAMKQGLEHLKKGLKEFKNK